MASNTRSYSFVVCIFAFIIAMPSDVALPVIGELYLTEILLIPLVMLLLVIHGSGGALNNTYFWAFLVSGCITLTGYIISDLAAGTEPSQYLRGWGRTALLVSNVICLVVLVSLDRRYLWWFILGLGTGLLLSQLSSGIPVLGAWKLNYSGPVGFIIIATAFLFPRLIGVFIIAALGILNLILDSRTQGAAILLTSMIMWARLRNPEQGVENLSQIIKLGVFGVIALILVSVFLNLTEEDFTERRMASNIGRTAGIVVSLKAISESPLIGYGSWTRNERFAKELRDKVWEDSNWNLRARPSGYGDLFRSHSYILQSAVEGGLFGAAFFIFYGIVLVREAIWRVLKMPLDFTSPVFLYFMINGFWHLLASPFGGANRLDLAIVAAIVAMTRSERIKMNAEVSNVDGVQAKEQVLENKHERKQATVLRRRVNKKTISG